MAKTHVTIPVFVPHMGCPHRCAFCNQNAQSGADETKVDIESLIILHRSRAPKSVANFELAFFGGSFTAIEHELKTALLAQGKSFINQGLISSIRISTRPDCISISELEYLKSFGVKTIEIGAQSFSDEVLNASKRGHNADDITNAANLIKANDFQLVLQLLPGLPGDSHELAITSAIKAAALSPNAARIYPAVVFKGTELAQMFERGEYNPPSLEDAVNTCAEIFDIFQDAEIPVIRTGIHPIENGSEKNIIAGAYHPSMGFLVKSRARRNMLGKIIENSGTKTIKLVLPFKGKEEYIGPGRQNIAYLEKKYGKEIKCSYADISFPQIGR